MLTMVRDVADTPDLAGLTLLGQWLELVRASRGHTLEDVERITGVSRGTLNRLKHATSRPYARTSAAIAAYLDVDVETIGLLCIEPASRYAEADLRRSRRDVRDRHSRLAQEIDLASRRRGHRLADVARATGITPATLSLLRRVGATMRVGTATALARYLACRADDVRSWALEPAAQRITYPQPTWIGDKLHPTVTPGYGCERCPFLEPCRRDVLERDGFAWCESLLAVDVRIDADPVTRRSVHYQDEEDL